VPTLLPFVPVVSVAGQLAIVRFIVCTIAFYVTAFFAE
jgi:hypothetical protein